MIFFKLVVAFLTIFLCAELKRVGGIGGKPFRRYLCSALGIGLTVSIGSFLLGCGWFSALVSLVLHLTLFWLPKTFFGSNILSHWFNKPWLYIEGMIEGFKLFPLLPGALAVIGAVSLGILFAKLEIANIKKKGLSDKIFGGAIGFLTVVLALR